MDEDTIGQIFADKMTLHELLDKMTTDEMTVDKMTVDEITTD